MFKPAFIFLVLALANNSLAAPFPHKSHDSYITPDTVYSTPDFVASSSPPSVSPPSHPSDSTGNVDGYTRPASPPLSKDGYSNAHGEPSVAAPSGPGTLVAPFGKPGKSSYSDSAARHPSNSPSPLAPISPSEKSPQDSYSNWAPALPGPVASRAEKPSKSSYSDSPMRSGAAASSSCKPRPGNYVGSSAPTPDTPASLAGSVHGSSNKPPKDAVTTDKPLKSHYSDSLTPAGSLVSPSGKPLRSNYRQSSATTLAAPLPPVEQAVSPSAKPFRSNYSDTPPPAPSAVRPSGNPPKTNYSDMSALTLPAPSVGSDIIAPGKISGDNYIHPSGPVASLPPPSTQNNYIKAPAQEGYSNAVGITPYTSPTGVPVSPTPNTNSYVSPTPNTNSYDAGYY